MIRKSSLPNFIGMQIMADREAATNSIEILRGQTLHL